MPKAAGTVHGGRGRPQAMVPKAAVNNGEAASENATQRALEVIEDGEKIIAKQAAQTDEQAKQVSALQAQESRLALISSRRPADGSAPTDTLRLLFPSQPR